MAKYPLGPLLSARMFREDAAERETRQTLAALERAHDDAEAAREELRRYSEWRPGEEKRLFEELRGNMIGLDVLDRHREDIQALRNAELQREDACRLADSAVVEAEGEVEKARRRQSAAARDRRKIEEHRDRWARLEAVREEAAAEAELEDFPARGAADAGESDVEPDEEVEVMQS